jgi:spermidine/putrescine transport system ATP-binding protein
MIFQASESGSRGGASEPRTDGRIALVALSKRFGETLVVDGIDLEIGGGEFFSLLGPSGCGKTTTLRMIGGFERPSAGQIMLDGRDVADVPAYRRDVHTVFQSYALFPHLSVADNVAFGLQRRRVSKSERRRRVADALALVQLGELGGRRPTQLSGGQQQRVALARALVLRPAVLLLDEPLGALDARIRKALQQELKAIQREVGITFVYVTHDQEEALTMSDRMAVMNGGRVEQTGSPREIYEDPATTFVAEFLGVSNLMTAVCTATAAEGCAVRVGEFDLRADRGEVTAGRECKVVIRPERVVLEPYGTPGTNRVAAMVEQTIYVGAQLQLIVRLAHGEQLQAMVPNDGRDVTFEQGTPVSVHLPARALRVMGATPSSRDAGAA